MDKVIELVYKDIKIVIKNRIHMFKMVEESMNTIRRELAINSTLRLNQQITWGVKITKFTHKESRDSPGYPYIY